MKHFSQPRNWHWYLTINYPPNYIQRSLVCPKSPVSVPESHPAQHISVSCHARFSFPWSVTVSWVFLVFDGCGNIKEDSQIACTASLSLVLSDDQTGVTWFWEEDCRRKVLFPSYHIEGLYQQGGLSPPPLLTPWLGQGSMVRYLRMHSSLFPYFPALLLGAEGLFFINCNTWIKGTKYDRYEGHPCKHGSLRFQGIARTKMASLEHLFR